MSLIPWLTMAALSAGAEYYNPIAQPGEPGYRPIPRHHFRGTMENDSAFGNDSSYTHGTRLDYACSLDNGDAWGISLTQNIYTPTIHTRGAVMGEHPYAGYLALGGAYLMRGENFGNAIELQIGTTGNASFARYAQNGLHEACGMQTWARRAWVAASLFSCTSILPMRWCGIPPCSSAEGAAVSTGMARYTW